MRQHNEEEEVAEASASGVGLPKEEVPALDVLQQPRREVATLVSKVAPNPSALGPLLQLLLSADDLMTGDTSGMSRFQRLLAQMPRIAGVINQFESTDVQRDVLNALIRAFETEEERRSPDGSRSDVHTHEESSLRDESIDLDSSRADFGSLMNGGAETADAEDASSIHAI